MDDDPVLGAVGPRLRALRRQRGATLTALSAATGISVSTLSRLESGGRKPTLEMLLALARAYHVPLDELVGMPAPTDPRVRAKPVQRHGRTLIPLTQRPGGPRAYKMIIPPAGSETDAEQQSHEGYEWMYVLSGRLRLRLAEHDFVMKAGEAAEFDTHIPHCSAAPGHSPPNCWSCSDPRANACTSAPAPAGPARSIQPKTSIAAQAPAPACPYPRYSLFRNSTTAIAAIASPMAATMPMETPSGTVQPPQVTPGLITFRAAALMLSCPKTALRIGPTM